MHERLTKLLDDADPTWSEYYVLVPYRDDPWYVENN
jgi:hypothetical protein